RLDVADVVRPDEADEDGREENRRPRQAGGELMNETTVTTPSELEIRVERVFDAPREHVFSVWTDPRLIPEWWGENTTVEEMDVRPGGRWRFNTGYGAVEGEFREVEPPARLVQTFQNHLQTLEFEDLGGDRTKLTQTMRFATTEERDTTMNYGDEERVIGAGGDRGVLRRHVLGVARRLRARERAGRPGDRDEAQPTRAQRFELRVEQACGDCKRPAGPVEAEREILLVAGSEREL